MAGNVTGGKKAAETNKRLYGEDWYIKIGSMGGKISRGGGFAYRKDCDCKLITGKHVVAQCAGKKGGALSRRTNQKQK
jgi:guanyl-specific ribonuclease Sa